MAMHPHMTPDAFRRAVVLAIDCRDKESHESFDQAFLRFANEAIYAYEREHCCR